MNYWLESLAEVGITITAVGVLLIAWAGWERWRDYK